MLVLFDLDGTLTDPFRGIAAGIRHACAQLDAAIPTDDVLRSMIGPPFQETFASVLGLPDHRVDEGIDHYRSVYEGGGLFDATVYDGVAAVLAQVQAAGHDLALATSKPTESATRVLAHFGLTAHFTFIGGASRDRTRHHKHDVIGHVLKEMGADSAQTIMIGDRRYDVEGARHWGIPTIGVRWGYAEEGELESAGAVHIAETPVHLGEVLSASLSLSF